MTNLATDTAVYLLGFAPVGGGASDLPPHDGFRIQSIVHADVRCWYVEMDTAEFAGPAAAANLEDLDWLTPRVLAHQQAVEMLSELGPLLPARFATLFSSLPALCHHVDHWRDAIHDYFARVGDKREWGCKVYARAAHQPPELAESPDADGAPARGKNYLLLRREAQQDRQRRSDRWATWIDDLQAQLETQGAAVVRRPLVRLDQSDQTRHLIGNLAVLADAPDWPNLLNVVRTYEASIVQPEQIEVEVAGPFVPYSFCPSLPSIQANAAP